MAMHEDDNAFEEKCSLLEQGFLPGSCAVWTEGRRIPACRATLKWENGEPYRLIKGAHLSRPHQQGTPASDDS